MVLDCHKASIPQTLVFMGAKCTRHPSCLKSFTGVPRLVSLPLPSTSSHSVCWASSALTWPCRAMSHFRHLQYTSTLKSTEKVPPPKKTRAQAAGQRGSRGAHTSTYLPQSHWLVLSFLTQVKEMRKPHPNPAQLASSVRPFQGPIFSPTRACAGSKPLGGGVL